MDAFACVVANEKKLVVCYFFSLGGGGDSAVNGQRGRKGQNLSQKATEAKVYNVMERKTKRGELTCKRKGMRNRRFI